LFGAVLARLREEAALRLLVVSPLYAPDLSPRAFRWTAIAEHWAAQGHEIDIVAMWSPGTVRDETRGGVRVHRVGGAIVESVRQRLRGKVQDGSAPVAAEAPRRRSIAGAVYDATLKQVFWPDAAFYWIPSAFLKAHALLRARRYDALVTVSHPFAGHVVGLGLKRRFPSMRWVVDIGDPFTLLREIPLNNPLLYTRLNRHAEHQVLSRADAVAVTVAACRDAYEGAFPDVRSKITVIPPLLSLPDRPAIEPITARSDRLVYVGTLYRALRNPTPLLRLFAALLQQRPSLSLHFYGDLHDCADLVTGEGVVVHGKVPRAEAVTAMETADVLVNIGNATPHQLPSKLVEYAAVGRPILNLVSTSSDTAANFLRDYPAALTLTGPDDDSVDAVLRFIDTTTPATPAQLHAFLAPFRIDPIADAYENLVRTPS
jgi:glycosyltransferase involved in cell wall biosynthesis